MIKVLKRISFITWILWITTGVIIFFLKINISNSSVKDVYWILLPTVKIVEAYTGCIFFFTPDMGFLNVSGSIVINEGCSGINYLIIVIISTIFASGLGRKSVKGQLILWPCLMMASLVFTVLVNAIRIILAVNIESVFGQNKFAHQACNIFVFCAFLILYYAGISYLLAWRKK